MGLFAKIFGTKPQNVDAKRMFETFSAYTPTFRSWSGAIYESELVRAAIDARARNISKLGITVVGAARPSLRAKLKYAPNEFHTWGQMLYRLSTILDCENTAFICPVFDDYGDQTGIFPLLPSCCSLVEDRRGTVYLRYMFRNGQTAAIELERCGIMTKYQYRDDFFGESNKALTPTMETINIQNQGIKEAVKSAASFRFMARYSNFLTDEDLTKERKRFSQKNFSGDAGPVLVFPNTYEDIKQIESKPFIVDADQMKAIQTNVFNYFGVNEDVLQNKAYGDAWSAFYEGAIEPFAIQFSDIASKMLFTQRERAQGSYVMATANRLQYMTNADKMNVSAQMADRGLMTRNEIREIWNLPPLPGNIGDTLPVRGEYYNLYEEDNKDGNE